MALVCAALMEETLDNDVSIAHVLDSDVFEIRLDFLKDTSDLSLLSEIDRPVIATCMPKWEGGFFEGKEEDRIDILRRALDHSSYVSIELKLDENLRDELIKEAKDKGVKVILTHHSFEKTPSIENMVSTLHWMQNAKADIAKVAYMPKSKEDALNVMAAQVKAELEIPVIALSMGDIGSFTRVLGPMLGGYLSFASADHEKKTAAGQFSLSDMNEIKRLLWK